MMIETLIRIQSDNNRVVELDWDGEYLAVDIAFPAAQRVFKLMKYEDAIGFLRENLASETISYVAESRALPAPIARESVAFAQLEDDIRAWISAVANSRFMRELADDLDELAHMPACDVNLVHISDVAARIVRTCAKIARSREINNEVQK